MGITNKPFLSTLWKLFNVTVYLTNNFSFQAFFVFPKSTISNAKIENITVMVFYKMYVFSDFLSLKQFHRHFQNPLQNRSSIFPRSSILIELLPFVYTYSPVRMTNNCYRIRSISFFNVSNMWSHIWYKIFLSSGTWRKKNRSFQSYFWESSSNIFEY